MNLSLAMPTRGVDTECPPQRLSVKPKGASHGQISAPLDITRTIKRAL